MGDRVLVDAPCYSDRHSVTSDEGNVFVKTEIKNRLRMPEKQSELLKNGLKHLAPGWSLVYSTCTLSPVQNDGVVNKVLTELWEETSLNFEVADLDLAMKPSSSCVRFLAERRKLNLVIWLFLFCQIILVQCIFARSTECNYSSAGTSAKDQVPL